MASWPYNTTAWQDLRLAKLSTDPLCEVCIRREVVTIANTVDHVVPINSGGDPFPPLDRLQSLCATCHQHKTNAERYGTSRKVKGCDIDGNPLDDADGWYAPAARSSSESRAAGPRAPSKTELVSPETKWEFI